MRHDVINCRGREKHSDFFRGRYFRTLDTKLHLMSHLSCSLSMVEHLQWLKLELSFNMTLFLIEFYHIN